jgi:hypothetical protein
MPSLVGHPWRQLPSWNNRVLLELITVTGFLALRYAEHSSNWAL